MTYLKAIYLTLVNLSLAVGAGTSLWASENTSPSQSKISTTAAATSSKAPDKTWIKDLVRVSSEVPIAAVPYTARFIDETHFSDTSMETAKEYKTRFRRFYVEDHSCFFVMMVGHEAPMAFMDVIPDPMSGYHFSANPLHERPKELMDLAGPPSQGEDLTWPENILRVTPLWWVDQNLPKGLHVHEGTFMCGPPLSFARPFELHLAGAKKSLVWTTGVQ